jgi:hypothetical protein
MIRTGLIAAGDIDTAGIVTWAATHIVPIVLAGLGILIIVGARKAQLSKVGGQIAVAIVGILMVALAFSLFAFGKNLADIVIT